MILPIIKYGDPLLQKVCEPVTVFDKALETLAKNMAETMYAAPGVGLAASQVGVLKRLIVVDVTAGEKQGQLITLVNPEIINKEGEQYEEEGCLSLPEIREKVKRAAKVKVRAQNIEGEWFEIEGEELLSRAFQHEIDHLDGVLFIDRLSRLKKDLLVRRIKKLIKNGEW